VKQCVLLVHSAGPQGPRQGSGGLVENLRRELGAAYEVLYPRMPEPERPRYASWKDALDHEFSALEERSAILVGHSLGGSVLLKYLSEEGSPNGAAGLFLVAAPYWGAEGWKVDEFALDSEFASRLPRSLEIFLYHSRKDPEVPFAHAAIYAARLSQATLRAIGGSEHEFKDGLRELADDIRERS